MSNKLAGCLGKSFWTGIGAIAAIAALIVAIISIPQANLIRQSISQTFSRTPQPTVASLVTVRPSITPQNKLLTCSNCPSDTILVTINKITVSTTRMIWDTTFTNQSGNDTNFYVRAISLQDLGGGKTAR